MTGELVNGSFTPTAATGSNGLLTVADLHVDFPTDDGIVRAVRGLSYTLAPREVLGIVGESGSGKSVASLAVMGLLPKSAQVRGTVRFRDEDLLGLTENGLSRYRGEHIAMIFQDPMTSLNPVYSVGWQIVEAIRAHRDISKPAALRQAVELLRVVGIPHAEERVHNYPHEFSGGMRQRAVIAIAIANDPDVIIADEPTTALDVTVQAQVLESLRAARERTGAAMILITHDLGVVAGQTDRVLVMYAGRAVEVGTADDVFYRPRMPYTLGLLGSLPRLDSTGRRRLTPIQGSPPSLINLPPGCPFAPRCPIRQPMCLVEEPELRPTDRPDHLAACHFSDQLVGVSPGDLFRPTARDDVLPAEGEPGPEVSS